MKIRVCFVCLGNICRSPTAEGIMRDLVDEAGFAERIQVSSAGVEAFHVGESPDPRSCKTAAARGVTLRSRGHQFAASDFARFDYVLAMDRENLSDLEKLASNASKRGQLSLLRAFDSEKPAVEDVPDPYYGGPGGFDRVFDICEASCRGLLQHIIGQHDLSR